MTWKVGHHARRLPTGRASSTIMNQAAAAVIRETRCAPTLASLGWPLIGAAGGIRP